jgi:hypothetical protein
MELATSSRTLLPRLDIPANALCTAERDPVATAERTRWLMVAARAQRLRADKAAARKRADDRRHRLPGPGCAQSACAAAYGGCAAARAARRRRRRRRGSICSQSSHRSLAQPAGSTLAGYYCLDLLVVAIYM